MSLYSVRLRKVDIDFDRTHLKPPPVTGITGTMENLGVASAIQ